MAARRTGRQPEAVDREVARRQGATFPERLPEAEEAFHPARPEAGASGAAAHRLHPVADSAVHRLHPVDQAAQEAAGLAPYRTQRYKPAGPSRASQAPGLGFSQWDLSSNRFLQAFTPP
mgnify:CR=1 FL=1